MNRCMNELTQMIPACRVVLWRLDKLSILKMAVDHMKSLRGMCVRACVHAYLRTCLRNRARVCMCLCLCLCLCQCLCLCVSICMCCTLSVCPSCM